MSDTHSAIDPERTIVVPRARWRQIIDELCRERGLRYDQLRYKGPGQNKYLRDRAAVARLLISAGYSFPHVGRMLNRNHSTIISYIGHCNSKPLLKGLR